MSIEPIQERLGSLVAYFTENPDKALSADKPATARLEDGLRCRATGANGAEIVSDMPKGIGGGATAPSPGWFLRAALANCYATMIALRAAELGITLTDLEVAVGSTSDDRGLLQMDDSIRPGFLDVQVRVRLSAEGASEEQLLDVVAWAERHSPLVDSVRRAVPLQVGVDVV